MQGSNPAGNGAPVVYVSTLDGHLLAFDLASGSPMWSSQLVSEKYAVTASPVVSGDGSIIAVTADSAVHCLGSVSLDEGGYLEDDTAASGKSSISAGSDSNAASHPVISGTMLVVMASILLFVVVL